MHLHSIMKLFFLSVLVHILPRTFLSAEDVDLDTLEKLQTPKMDWNLPSASNDLKNWSFIQLLGMVSAHHEG